MKRIVSIATLLLFTVMLYAQNWDYIKASGEYYFGEGIAATEDEADKAALAALSSMISVHVSSDFNSTYTHENNNNGLNHKEYVSNCVNTYTSSTLTNCERMTMNEGKNVTVRRWLQKTELAKIFKNRISKAVEMSSFADDALSRNRVGLALQNYYWAYSLVRSVQYPDEVVGEDGKSLMLTLPNKIREVLGDLSVELEDIDGEDVDLLFTYKGNPVSGLEFTYNDGRAECIGKVKDGRGNMQMMPGWDNSYYFINIEYEYKSLARGDNEMQSVMDVVSRCSFDNEHKIKAGWSQKRTCRTAENPASAQMAENSGIKLQPAAEQTVSDDEYYQTVMNAMVKALKTRSYTDVQKYMTIEGMDIFKDIISEGHGKVVGTPSLNFFKSQNGTVVARGVQMSFCFTQIKKSTFIEDVAFYFDKDKKIDNIAFGLGNTVENEILTKYSSSWRTEERELLMEFLENYRTAYCLKRLDYIRDIFADDAIIIVGNVIRRTNKTGTSAGNYTATVSADGKFDVTQNEPSISQYGQNLIRYNRYSKDEYLKHLALCFKRSEFINIRFTQSDFQKLDKFKDRHIYAVQLGQDYVSTRYSDFGYLFLMIDMTDPDEPYIKVRTWQPEYVPVDQRYSAGDFYEN